MGSLVPLACMYGVLFGLFFGTHNPSVAPMSDDGARYQLVTNSKPASPDGNSLLSPSVLDTEVWVTKIAFRSGLI